MSQLKFYGSLRSIMTAIQSRPFKVYPANLIAFDSSGNQQLSVINRATTVSNTISDTAIIDENGRVYTYGEPASHRRWLQYFLTRIPYANDIDPATISLRDIRRIYTNDMAFCAVRLNGSVVAWGKTDYGANLLTYPSGVPTSVQTDLQTGVIYINSTSDAEHMGGAFVALKGDGSVVVWGNSQVGGDASPVIAQLTNVIDVKSSAAAFAALRHDGSVLTWGNPEKGGLIPNAVFDDISSGIIQLYNTQGAFAALRCDYRLFVWGDPYFGGDATGIHTQLYSIVDVREDPYSFTVTRSDGKIYKIGYNSDKAFDPINNGNTITKNKLVSNYASLHTSQLIEGDIMRYYTESTLFGASITEFVPYLHNQSNTGIRQLLELPKGEYSNITFDTAFRIYSDSSNNDDPFAQKYYANGNSSPIQGISAELILYNATTDTSSVITYVQFSNFVPWTNDGRRPYSQLITANLNMLPLTANPLLDTNTYPNNRLFFQLRITPKADIGIFPFEVKFERLKVIGTYVFRDDKLDFDMNGDEPIFNGLLSSNDKISIFQNIFFRYRCNPPPNDVIQFVYRNLPYQVVFPRSFLNGYENNIANGLITGNNIVFPLVRGEIIKVNFGLFSDSTQNEIRYITYYNETIYEIPILRRIEQLNLLNDYVYSNPAPYLNAIFIKDFNALYQAWQNETQQQYRGAMLMVPFKRFNVKPVGENYSFSYILDKNQILLAGITKTPPKQEENEFIYDVTYINIQDTPIRNPEILQQAVVEGKEQRFVPTTERIPGEDVYCILTGYSGVVAQMQIEASGVSMANVVPLKMEIALENVKNVYNEMFAFKLKANGRDRYTGIDGDYPPGYDETNYPVPVTYNNITDSWSFILQSFSLYQFGRIAAPIGITGGDPIVQPLRYKGTKRETLKIPNHWKRILLYEDREMGVRVEADCSYLTESMIRSMHSYRNGMERPYFVKTPDFKNSLHDRKIYDYLRRNTFFSMLYFYRFNKLEARLDLFDPYINYNSVEGSKWFQRIYPGSKEGVYSFGKKIHYPCSSKMHAYKVRLEKENWLYVYSDIHWDECTSMRLEMNKYEFKRPIYRGELFEHSDEYLLETFTDNDADRARP
jgi:hypothetical protein